MSNNKQYCKNCGKELVQTNGHRQKEFCCDNCRKAFWHKQQMNKHRRCCWCNKIFVAKDPRAMYCSDFCRRMGRMKSIIIAPSKKSF